MESDNPLNVITGLGKVSIRDIDNDHPRPRTPSLYEDWGPMAPEAKEMQFLRWLIELTRLNGEVVAVGDMSSHVVWYGPTVSSKAMNIGISILEEYRGKGIGAIAQRLVAEELHRLGYARVEAGTDVENIPEQKSLLKAGYLLEGVPRRAQGRADGLHDLQIWSHIS